MASDLEVLTQAHRLVEKGWCQGAFARDKNDVRCYWWNNYATKFCLSGALLRSGLTYEFNPFLISRIQKVSGVSETSTSQDSDLSLWNDHPSTTKENVLNVLTQAVKEAQNVQDNPESR